MRSLVFSTIRPHKLWKLGCCHFVLLLVVGTLKHGPKEGQLRSLGFSRKAQIAPFLAHGSTLHCRLDRQLHSTAVRYIFSVGPEGDNGNSGVHRGTAGDGGVTRIGSHNLLMAYVHIAHGCQLGSHIIMTNGATSQALEAIEARGFKWEHVRLLVDFFRTSARGVTK